MDNHGPFPQPYKSGKKYIVLSIPTGIPRLVRNMGLITAILAGSNYMTYRFASSGKQELHAFMGEYTSQSGLYLLDKAGIFVRETAQFENKVKEISNMLDIPVEWLMAVMYAESKFDASIYNHKGSGAVGLIQFMPSTAMDMNISAERLSRMDHVQQLEYVYIYLQRVREKYGDYASLTDLYLGILYPKARNQDECYTLYAKPSVSYSQNSGLDENGDGRVTISDIDQRMERLFPTAYNLKKFEETSFPH